MYVTVAPNGSGSVLVARDKPLSKSMLYQRLLPPVTTLSTLKQFSNFCISIILVAKIHAIAGADFESNKIHVEMIRSYLLLLQLYIGSLNVVT